MMQLAKTIRIARQGRDRPVIVIDIATATPADRIRVAGSALKELVEMSGVIGILILSNVSSVHYLRDTNRNKQHVVDGVLQEEVDAYFNMQQVLVDDDGRAFRRRIIEEDSAIIGTLKLFSKAYIETCGDEAKKLAAVRIMFNARAEKADGQVEDLLTENPQFRVLVQRLLSAEESDAGVSSRGFGFPSALTVAPVLQNFNSPTLQSRHRKILLL
jgi:hypothetical protein